MKMNQSVLGSGFLNSAERFPERNALEVADECWTYRQLRDKSAALAATLHKHRPHADPQLTAVLAHRSVTAFAGILGTLLRGHGYVPLNPNFPPERTATMLDRSGCTSLVVGNEAAPILADLLNESNRDLLVVLPDWQDADTLRDEYPAHTILDQRDLVGHEQWRQTDPSSDDTAYLLFTSGSTGIPKGVQVSHSNIARFIDVVLERYQLTERDRFSQMFDLVFDLSLFDLFVAWAAGACLCCPSAGDARLPAKFIMESKITIWFSVPSLGFAMKQMRMLRPGLYPDLRVSLFCGEALLADVAAAWAEAAPNSIVENLYGPTEVTLACTAYRWTADRGPAEAVHGMVPIGTAFPGMTAIVTDENLHEVAPGSDGELLMSGPQVAPGYWHDEEKTAASFVHPPGKTERHYRTGDLVRCPAPGEPIVYLGRVDHQVKIRGNRVELGEIEEVLRAVDGVDNAVAIGWPVTPAGVDGIVAFIQGGNVDRPALDSSTTSRLPSYMVPKEYRMIEDMPLNQNGKIDRKALARSLDETGS